MSRKYDRKAKGLICAENTYHKGFCDRIGDKTKPKCRCGWEGRYHDFPYAAISELDGHYDKFRIISNEE